jgi:membrane protease YdiL (CAAX protease family)
VEELAKFTLIFLIANGIAYFAGFYRLQKPEKRVALDGKTVFVSFAIYVGTMMILAPLLNQLAYHLGGKERYSIASQPAAMTGWIQLLSLTLVLFLLFFFCRTRDLSVMKTVWKDPSRPGSRSIIYDFGLGILSWLISFPLVLIIGQLSDLLLFHLFGVQTYEQVAVRYLKTSFPSPSLLFVALTTILLAAPVIEEFLFRGLLQTWFKRYLGSKAAILLSALCFALFHLAPSQGIGNISLGLSLFGFACFLGFLYERQGSLFATIGLHMTFNAVSTFRILFD